MRVLRREVLVVGLAGLAGCSLTPDEPEPIEASAATPAVLSAAAGATEVTADRSTFEVTVQVDLSGDVQISSSRDVTATVFRRIYEVDDGRVGLVTAPAVRVFESPEVIRDPVASLDATRAAELATELSVERVDATDDSGSATLLGTDTSLTTGTATTGDGEAPFTQARVRAGEDSVTAVAVGPASGDVPFDAVTRDG